MARRKPQDSIESGSNIPAWALSPRGASYIEIRINRNMLIAAVVSLLLHVLALLFLIQQKLNEKSPVETQQQPITVRLNPRVPV